MGILTDLTAVEYEPNKQRVLRGPRRIHIVVQYDDVTEQEALRRADMAARSIAKRAGVKWTGLMKVAGS